MKKFLSVIMSAVILLSVFSGFSITACAAAPYVTHTAPKTLKIGQAMPPWEMTYHNLPANTKMVDFFGTGSPTFGNFSSDFYAYGGWGDGPNYVMTDEKGQYRFQFDFEPLPSLGAHLIAIRAGTSQFQPKYQLWDDDYNNNKNPVVNIGNPIKLTIEEPVIKHNAPKSVKIGQSITFTTALTNTALTNVPISKYTSLNNTKLPQDYAVIICPVYYVPVITVIEGKELIKQSGQDYSQTQKSSETITFNKAGTVKLKITYKKYILGTAQKQDSNGKWCDPTFDIKEDGSRNPEKIVTVNVTDPNAPVTPTKPNEKPSKPNGQPTDPSKDVLAAPTSSPDESTANSEQPTVIIENEDTDIKITAPCDLLPDGTELKAALIAAGEQFNKVTDALKDIAKKASVFDISLEKDGSKVTFDGKVTVSLPIPEGYEKSRLAVFYISDGGERTEISCTVNGDTVTFETNHFSIYALAEKTEEAAALDTPDTAEAPDASKTPDASAQKKSKTALYIGLAVGGVILLAGAGVAVWYFKFRKKPDEAK